MTLSAVLDPIGAEQPKALERLFEQEDDNLRAPDVKYDLRSFHKDTRSRARVLTALRGGA
jgi:hypothetical protein